MTAYGGACACGWTIEAGNAHRKGGWRDRLAAGWVNLRWRLHNRRCHL